MSSPKNKKDTARPRSSSVSELIRAYSTTDTPSAKVTIGRRQVDIKAYFSKTGKDILKATSEAIGIKTHKPRATDTSSLSSQTTECSIDTTPTDSVFMETDTSPKSQRNNIRGQKRGPTTAPTSSADNSPIKKDARIESTMTTEVQITDLNDKIVALTKLSEVWILKCKELEAQVLTIRETAIDDKLEILTGVHNLQAEVTRIDETLLVHEAQLSKHDKAFQLLDANAGTNINGAVTQMSLLQDEVVNSKTTLATMEAMVKGLKLSGAGNRNSRGLYIAGIDKIKAHFKLRPNTHPLEAVKTLLWYSQCFSQYESIVPLERHKHWSEVRSALIFSHSPQNKKDLELALKRFFQTTNVKGVLLRDIFPSDKIQEAKDLTKIAVALREKGDILKFRVVNKADRPVLQVLPNAAGVKGYQDYKTDDNMDTASSKANTHATGSNALPLGTLALSHNPTIPAAQPAPTVPDGYPPLIPTSQQSTQQPLPSGPKATAPQNSTSQWGAPHSTAGPSSGFSSSADDQPRYNPPPWMQGGLRFPNGIPA